MVFDESPPPIPPSGQKRTHIGNRACNSFTNQISEPCHWEPPRQPSGSRVDWPSGSEHWDRKVLASATYASRARLLGLFAALDIAAGAAGEI